MARLSDKVRRNESGSSRVTHASSRAFVSICAASRFPPTSKVAVEVQNRVNRPPRFIRRPDDDDDDKSRFASEINNDKERDPIIESSEFALNVLRRALVFMRLQKNLGRSLKSPRLRHLEK